MTRKHIGIMIAAAVAAVGLGVGVTAAAVSGSPASQRGTAGTAVTAAPPYSYYQSMMGRYYGGAGMMMGGGYASTMGSAGYRWMFGDTTAPAWMRGARLPATMMGTDTGMGQVIGRLWAGAPGPRVSPGQAAVLGGQLPVGATVSRSANTVTSTTRSVHLTALASPAGGPDEIFRIAGLTDPGIVVPAGARVTIRVINTDPDTAHRLVITHNGKVSRMPMMTDRPAFTGSALWFLGDPTAAGMHTATMAFTAVTPDRYTYLCPVPGHAQKGMTGQFTVTRS